MSEVTTTLSPRDHPALGVTARYSAAACLAALVAAGTAVALAAAAANHGYVVPALVRQRADWVVGPLAGLAVPTSITGFFVRLGVMALAYAGVVALAPRLSLRWVVAAVAALHVVFLLAPPLLSTDVFNYVDYARLAVRHGLDPYTHPPASARHDAVFVFVHWRHTVAAYGPLFILATRPLGLVTPAEAVWALKAVAAAAGLGCTTLVWWIARRLGRPVTRAVAAFGLNPILLVWAVGGAHNDLLMLLALLVGVALALAARPAMGGAALAGAVAIKATAGVALPFLLLAARRRGRALVGLAACGALLAAVTFAAFPDHALGMVGVLRRAQSIVAYDGVPLELSHTLGLATVTPGERAMLGAVLGLALLLLLVRVWRGADPLTAAGWAFVALLATSTWLLGWYTVWPLAFAALSRDRRLLIATCALELSFAIGELPVG